MDSNGISRDENSRTLSQTPEELEIQKDSNAPQESLLNGRMKAGSRFESKKNHVLTAPWQLPSCRFTAYDFGMKLSSNELYADRSQHAVSLAGTHSPRRGTDTSKICCLILLVSNSKGSKSCGSLLSSSSTVFCCP